VHSTAYTEPPRSRAERGQALVEFALVATLMVLLLAAVVQFGLIFERQIGINNAVREAARRGATLSTADSGAANTNAAWTLGQLQTLLANSQEYSAAQARNLRVCFNTPAAPYDTDAAGNKQVMVTVEAGYSHPLFLPLISAILDGLDGSNDSGLLLSTTASFRVQEAGSVDVGSGNCATP
jgi:Flp pilus assembly protein TadG